MDMKVGDRMNSLRVDQAAATGATNIATACPFCLQMLEDGVSLRIVKKKWKFEISRKYSQTSSHNKNNLCVTRIYWSNLEMSDRSVVIVALFLPKRGYLVERPNRRAIALEVIGNTTEFPS